MTRLVIGCPVHAREWVLDEWFRFTEAAYRDLDVEVSYAFVVSTLAEKTTPMIAARMGVTAPIVMAVDEGEHKAQREWHYGRYGRMVELRNQLLGLARNEAPDYFLSLDSDILLHPQALSNLLESIERFDAVGGKAFMTSADEGCTPLTSYPSYAFLTSEGSLRRENTQAVFQTDVIMAIKLMTPAAYNVDYQIDERGEDIGWSRAATEAGLTLGFDGRLTNKHVMHHRMLTEIDPRCGF